MGSFDDLFGMLGGIGAGSAMSQAHLQQQHALQYQQQMNDRAIEMLTGCYSTAFGVAQKPRACAYCGTKHDHAARCESCGAPNRA